MRRNPGPNLEGVASTSAGRLCLVLNYCSRNHLLEIAVSGYLAKRFRDVRTARYSFIWKDGELQHQIKCAARSSDFRRLRLLRFWTSRTSLQVNQNTCDVLVQVWYDYNNRSPSPGKTHASFYPQRRPSSSTIHYYCCLRGRAGLIIICDGLQATNQTTGNPHD